MLKDTEVMRKVTKMVRVESAKESSNPETNGKKIIGYNRKVSKYRCRYILY